MYSLGFDIGGTTVKAGLFDDGMKMLCKLSVPTPYGDAEALAKLIRSLADELAPKDADIADIPVGVTVPGAVDDSGRIKKLPNLGLADIPLGAMLEGEFGFPVRVCNDADAAALAELNTGALRGVKNGLMITIGTGLGGSVILDGKLFAGGMGRGSELGHMILARGGEPCGCGGRGCAETLCSASALARLAQKACNERTGMIYSLYASGAKPDAKLLIDCAMAGDEYALAAFGEYLDALSDALASLVNLLDPEVIVVGGGVCAAGEFLLEPLRRLTARKCYFGSCGRIEAAASGNDAGMIGAAIAGAER